MSNPEGNIPGIWVWADDAQKVGNAGTNTFRAKFTPDDGDVYNSIFKDVTVTVSKANSAVTEAPIEKELTYNGQPQELVSAGTTKDGEMQYALGENEENEPSTGWDSSIPTATDAETYYVWYKVVGDENHNDSAAACVTVTVNAPVFGPAAFTLPTGIKTIGESAFEGDKSITIVDASHCESIGANAFKGCTKLTQILLPKDCTVSSAAFTDCGTVYVFAPTGGATVTNCARIDNCVFVEETLS